MPPNSVESDAAAIGGNRAARPDVADRLIDGVGKSVEGVAGGIDLHRPVDAVGNENAIDKRQSLDAMVLSVADQWSLRRLRRRIGCPAVGRIDAAIAPAGEAVAAGHHVDQVERLDRFVWESRGRSRPAWRTDRARRCDCRRPDRRDSPPGPTRSRARLGQCLPPFRRRQPLAA